MEFTFHAAVADNGMVFVTCNSQTGHPVDVRDGEGAAYAINPALHLKQEQEQEEG